MLFLGNKLQRCTFVVVSNGLDVVDDTLQKDVRSVTLSSDMTNMDVQVIVRRMIVEVAFQSTSRQTMFLNNGLQRFFQNVFEQRQFFFGQVTNRFEIAPNDNCLIVQILQSLAIPLQVLHEKKIQSLDHHL